MTAGEKIRKRRLELGIKQKDVAARVGLTASYVSAIEKGRRKGKVKSLEKFAEALECSVSEIESDDSQQKVDPSNDNFGAVCNCAVRYCLGRRSYMPGLVTAYIIPLLPELSENTIFCFRRDIEERKKTGFGFGDACDVETWEKFYQAVCKETERRKHE